MRQGFLLIAGLFLWAAPVEAQTSQPLAVAPFELIGEKIFLKARVNGSPVLNLQFDTGAGSSVIDDSTAARLGLVVSGETTNEGAAGSGSVPTSANNMLELEGLAFPDITLLHLPLGEYSGVKRDAVVGYDMLKQYVIRIDYDTKTMAFYDPKSFRYSGKGRVVRFRLWDNSALVDMNLVLQSGERLRAKVMVDDGADLALLLNSPFVASHDLMQKVGKVAKGSISGSDGAEVGTFRGKVRSATIGGVRFDDFPVRLTQAQSGTLSLSDLDGILGNPILKMFNITFDYRRKRMYWERNGSFSPTVR